ncbi:carboxymuconolactone decarboxylase family protein [Spongiimicrobium sp. 3-5]|uniref:carboxymuconolactone decarboxylase family protein n=1 Tax=Spongiimicrobium sp. 3-5 TaxID=3332596 RepID=UPI00397EE54C
MSWIKVIRYEQADRTLKRVYDRVKGPNNVVDNVLSIHSLRPHTLVGHMTLYKSVLHNGNNALPKWYLEAIGVYVSRLNKCNYCVEHHLAGLRRLLQDDVKVDAYMDAIEKDTLNGFFNDRYDQGLAYARKLTLNPTELSKTDVENLINKGFTDGEVLEINQVSSYFNYVNRTVVGLGVNTKGDILGLSPNNSEDPTNWNHQ